MCKKNINKTKIHKLMFKVDVIWTFCFIYYHLCGAGQKLSQMPKFRYNVYINCVEFEKPLALKVNSAIETGPQNTAYPSSLKWGMALNHVCQVNTKKRWKNGESLWPLALFTHVSLISIIYLCVLMRFSNLVVEALPWVSRMIRRARLKDYQPKSKCGTRSVQMAKEVTK